MATPVHIKTMGLEMTRRCLATCSHCMRGEAQNIDMSPSIIQETFKNKDHEIISIDEFYLTGGETLSNEKGFVYLLEYLLENKIPVNEFYSIINGLVYNSKIIKRLQYLEKTGTKVNLTTFKDQFHPKIPAKNLKKLFRLNFYHYYEEFLKYHEIYHLGRAIENHLGSESSLAYIMQFFLKIKNYVVIESISSEKLSIESLYVTAKGKFGEEPVNATWHMIDQKYTLDIVTDSLFTNCIFPNLKQDLEIMKETGKTFPIDSFITDYENAKRNGCLDIFLHNLNEDTMRNYLLHPQKRVRERN